MSLEERLARPHVVRRLQEIRDGKEDGKPGRLITNTAAERVGMFNDYVRCVKKDKKKEPIDLSNEELLEDYEGFLADIHRYTQWNDENNFAIMALAVECAQDIKEEILRRMK